MDDVHLAQQTQADNREQRQQHESGRLQSDEADRSAGDSDHRQHVVETAYHQPRYEQDEQKVWCDAHDLELFDRGSL